MKTQYFYERKVGTNGALDNNYGSTMAVEVPSRSVLTNLVQRKLNGELELTIDAKVGRTTCRNERFIKSEGRKIASERLQEEALALQDVMIKERSVELLFFSETSYFVFAYPLIGNEETTRFVLSGNR